MNPKAGWLVVGAASVKKADALVTRLLELLGGRFKLGLVQTSLASAAAMAAWLAEKVAPAAFNINCECELKQPGAETATLRYARPTLEIDEVGEHLCEGTPPSQLSLSWAADDRFGDWGCSSCRRPTAALRGTAPYPRARPSTLRR